MKGLTGVIEVKHDDFVVSVPFALANPAIIQYNKYQEPNCFSIYSFKEKFFSLCNFPLSFQGTAFFRTASSKIQSELGGGFAAPADACLRRQRQLTYSCGHTKSNG
jgi:hypothetical protein